MANEATLEIETSLPVQFTVADATGIEKGTVCKMTDSMTAIASSGTGDVFAGITSQEKIANNGQTKLALYRRGVFLMTAVTGATITTGEWVATSGSNLIRTATEAEVVTGKGIGIALEDIASATTGFVCVGGY